MELDVIRVGDYFINLRAVLWAKITADGSQPEDRSITLVCGIDTATQYLHFQGNEAEEVIKFLESHGRDLTPPAFQPLD